MHKNEWMRGEKKKKERLHITPIIQVLKTQSTIHPSPWGRRQGSKRKNRRWNNEERREQAIMKIKNDLFSSYDGIEKRVKGSKQLWQDMRGTLWNMQSELKSGIKRSVLLDVSAGAHGFRIIVLCVFNKQKEYAKSR
jgi:hypothetical protein